MFQLSSYEICNLFSKVALDHLATHAIDWSRGDEKLFMGYINKLLLGHAREYTDWLPRHLLKASTAIHGVIVGASMIRATLPYSFLGWV